MEQPINKVNVIIADDKQDDLKRIQEAVKANPNYNVLKTFDCGNDMMRFCGKTRSAAIKPTIALIDYEMNYGDGVQTCHYISHFLKNIPCLAISTHDHSKPIQLMYQAGAKGYIHKSFLQNQDAIPGFGNFTFSHLHTAIDCILAGNYFIDKNFEILSPTVLKANLNPINEFTSRAKTLQFLSDKKLTILEQEVALLKSYALCTKQIAEAVEKTDSCVEKSIQSIKSKLGLKDAVEIPQVLKRFGIALYAEMQYSNSLSVDDIKPILQPHEFEDRLALA